MPSHDETSLPWMPPRDAVMPEPHRPPADPYNEDPYYPDPYAKF